ncbi:MAG: hypothetical protein ACO4AL_09515 [Steroidobacteraceae bacterium]|jgi:hypothetical protein
MVKSIIFSAALLAAALVPTVAAEATEEVTRRHTLRAEGVQVLKIDAGVGSVRVEPGTADTYQVVVTIEPAKKGWFGKKADVSKAQLKIERSGERLQLSLDPDSVDGASLQGTWRVKLPAQPPAEVEVDLGVGEARIEAPASVVRLDVGVGEAKVVTAAASAGAVSAAAGVGDAHITGAEASRQRHVVGGQSSARGQGQRDITVNVGVGEAGVTLSRD